MRDSIFLVEAIYLEGNNYSLIFNVTKNIRILKVILSHALKFFRNLINKASLADNYSQLKQVNSNSEITNYIHWKKNYMHARAHTERGRIMDTA